MRKSATILAVAALGAVRLTSSRKYASGKGGRSMHLPEKETYRHKALLGNWALSGLVAYGRPLFGDVI